MKNELSQRQFALLLSLAPNLGMKTIEKIFRMNKTASVKPEEFLLLSKDKLKAQYGFSNKAIINLTVGLKALLEQMEQLDAKLTAHNVQIITLHDDAYPSGLDEFMETPPPLLFAYGNTKLIDKKRFSILVSRKPSKAGLIATEQAVEAGVFDHSVLVCGHNTDGYQRAAITALRWGAPRILVFDCGLFRALGEDLETEPFRTARLYRYKFDPKTDLAVSPFRLNDHPIGRNNQYRDELISALSDELFVSEIRQGGMMEKMGLRALELGEKKVYIYGNPNDPYNNGTQVLLDNGAVLGKGAAEPL